jgi:hypothetical protein
MVIGLIMIVGLTNCGSEPQGPDSRAARLEAMRSFAGRVTMNQTTSGARVELERVAEPVYRFDDPARHNLDGTVWAWGRSGRPAALLTVAKYRAPDGSFGWLGEFTSVAPGPLAAAVEGVGVWQPASAGLVMEKFPKAEQPADDAARRLRQMKELVRAIKAYEYFKPRDQPSVERYELRVLPQPAYRYADLASGLIDGGMFIISYGLNPELVVLVEARREGSSPAAWHYGFARIAIAEIHVELDGKEVWTHRGGNPRRADDTYRLFTRPIEERAGEL